MTSHLHINCVNICLDIGCFMPANGESVSIACDPHIPVDISLPLLKRAPAVNTNTKQNGDGDCETPATKRIRHVEGLLLFSEDDVFTPLSITLILF